MSQILAIDSSTDIKKVGSLGAYLAILRRANVTVVDGFVLPTDFTLDNGGSNEILRAFDNLKCDFVVIRCSAVSHETETETLRKVHRDAVVDAVQYLLKKASHATEKTAIVVQKDLTAEISGTVYSHNPTTDNKNEAMIVSNLWMNDTVLLGECEPDIVLLDKATGALTMESDEDDEHYLSSKQIHRIYSLLRRVEMCSSFDLAVDWALDNDKLYVLNVRPMTKKIKERLF